MSKILLPVFSTTLLLFLSIPSLIGDAFGLEPPRIIPHSAHIDKSVTDVFKALRAYFSDRAGSKFELVSSSEKTVTLIAKQTGIDSARWKTWAACETDPIHMIYQLDDAQVTLTIKLEQSSHDTTFMTVSADFQGVYGLAQDRTILACKSTGVLEDDILALAGAQIHGGEGSTNSPAPGH